jgi:hypothetical protein
MEYLPSVGLLREIATHPAQQDWDCRSSFCVAAKEALIGIHIEVEISSRTNRADACHT